MATKLKRLSFYLRTFALLELWLSAAAGNCQYGRACAPRRSFDPAPPGQAPACALPGLTYCVHPDPYPDKIIRNLVDAGRYDIRTLLSDESRDEFAARRGPYGYGPHSLPDVGQVSLVNDYRDSYDDYRTSYNGVFSQRTPLQPPSPAEPRPFNFKYHASNYSKHDGFRGFQTFPANYWPQPSYYDGVYRSGNPAPYPSALHSPSYDGQWYPTADVTRYNPSEWWKYVNPSRSDTDVTIQRSITFPTRTSTLRRNETDLWGGRGGGGGGGGGAGGGRVRRRRNAELVEASRKRKLTGAEALQIALGFASAETSAERPRRQAPNTEQLCQIRTQFVTPRAALNNRGTWKYIVNMPDNMTQLVRAEICTSTECSGLCSVPAGYSTKCEQKYVQKRLVALESDGQNLYTDVFWIPSCCQCTIINNNST